jgi:hypothetical protein
MRDKISFVLQEKSTTARIFAGVVGKIISLIPVLGLVCQLMTRNSCIAICERNTWDSKDIIWGTYKVRNETKWNKINENETKRNEINKNETKRNEINETKRNQRNETKPTRRCIRSPFKENDQNAWQN